MKSFDIIVRNQTIKFYPKSNESKFYFEVEGKGGFYTKDCIFYFGKPTIKNAVEVATSYIECHKFRIEIFDNFAKKRLKK